MNNEQRNWSEEASKIKIEPSKNLFNRIIKPRQKSLVPNFWVGIAALLIIGMASFGLWMMSANAYGTPKQVEDLVYSPQADREFKNNEHLMRVYYRNFGQNFY